MADDGKRSKLTEAGGGAVEQLAFPKKNSGTPHAVIPPVDDPTGAMATSFVADQGGPADDQTEAMNTSFAVNQAPTVAAPAATKLSQIEVANVFDDLSQFQDTAMTAVEAVKRALNRVPLSRAQGGDRKGGSFVRVHPTFELIGVGIVSDPRTKETHLVWSKQMVALLAKWVEPVDLHVAITREGFDQGHWPVHLWPVPASPHDKSGKANAYYQTHRTIAQKAKTRWLRMIGGHQQYEEDFPENPSKLPEVNWAEMPWVLKEILAKAFVPSTHVITNDRHSLVSYLLGRE
jgi:hypothetical protein